MAFSHGRATAEDKVVPPEHRVTRDEAGRRSGGPREGAESVTADEQELMDAGVGTEEHNGDGATRRGPREVAAASSSRRPLQRGSPRGPQPGSSAGWKMTEDKGERPDPPHR